MRLLCDLVVILHDVAGRVVESRQYAGNFGAYSIVYARHRLSRHCMAPSATGSGKRIGKKKKDLNFEIAAGAAIPRIV
jgi:hypothetical protein